MIAVLNATISVNAAILLFCHINIDLIVSEAQLLNAATECICSVVV